jgi:hypothetical protein
MFRLALALLLLLPSLAFGQTIKLPAEINVSQDAVLVQPEFSDIASLKDIKWAVLGLKAAPSFSYLDQPFVRKPKSGIMLRSPAVGDEITIVIVALWNNGNLSDPVITNVKRATGGQQPPVTPTAPSQPSSPPTQPATPPGVDRDLPPNTTGVSAILVVDPSNVSPDVSALGVGSNAISRALSKGGAWYVRNNTDSLVAGLRPSWEGKQLPVLVVIDAKTNPRKVYPGVSITPSGNADLTAKQIITQIANALGP